MTTIRTDQIQCRADEAAATTYNYEHDGQSVEVLALDKASADETFADWRTGRIRAGELASVADFFADDRSNSRTDPSQPAHMSQNIQCPKCKIVIGACWAGGNCPGCNHVLESARPSEGSVPCSEWICALRESAEYWEAEAAHNAEHMRGEEYKTAKRRAEAARRGVIAMESAQIGKLCNSPEAARPHGEEGSESR